ncbi:uncharacterized protein sytl2a isoform X3 [Pangasianodon hypophthalmus]|uniref:uncharacterized protein sytl2a isoform X3 n=1 Tax=Pangasianodon hypophthalmus TaxID=310915 RepID=UPI002307013F|nr:uncharacterized protein sytl2a isoform X3 [Pangasianodon hypophthalmus]
MIDLSYLTEEEQEMILSVLKRDAELKHKEEQRIKKLQKTEQDKHKLKYLTGEWFYETKSSRHSDKIHGSDIIRASMMHRKPVTIMELTQIWPGKSSFLKNENKDIFIPPELCGLIGDPSSSAHDTREDHYQVAESKPSAHPQTKPRQNPFNSKPIGLESPVKTDGHLQTGANIQQIPGNLHQVPADQQPAVESLSSLPKPCQAPQIPAEDYHEDLAEPHSSQVSEPSDSLVEQGKVNQPSTEGHFHTLTEEDESSINKVLGWVGMMSRHSAKGNERPGGQEEQNREGLEGTPDTENASHTQTEIKAKPSPKLRMGLPGLFSRKNTGVETSENVLDKVDDVCRPEDKKDNIILGCSAQNSASGLNFITEELEANPCLSMLDDRSHNIADDDIQRNESLYRDEGSQNRLASLMSFWESGNKGPKVLSIKKSETNENKVSDRKIPKVEFDSSPSETKFFKYTDICESYKSFSESHSGTSHDDNISVIPSVGEKMSSCDTGQKPQEHGLEIGSTSESLNSPIKQMDDIPIYKLKENSPVLSVRKAITEKDTTSDLKACWEREKGSPKIIISTPDCIPKHYSQQGLNISTNPNRVESPETSSSSLNRELGVLKASSIRKLEQSSKRVLVNSPIDDTDRKSYSRSPFKTCMLGSDESIKFSPVSYPIRNISSVSQDHSDQSTGDTMKILEQSSPRHTPKVLFRGLFTVKESRMVGSPVRTFPIDINPTEKTPLKGLEHTPGGQTRYPHGLSSAEVSSPGKDGNLLAERPEQHLLSFPGNTPERNIQYQLTSPHSPPCFGRSQDPGTIYVGNINSKQTSQVHSLPVSQGQTSVRLITSPEHHRKTTTKSSTEGIEEVIPVVLPEQTQLDNIQCKTSLTRPSIHLSCQHHLSLAESTHVSRFSDQTDKQEWAGVQACESSEHMSSSSSASAEAWSLSRTSSACGSDGPSPVSKAQKQASIRPLSTSKSLEGLATSPSKDERWKNEPTSGITQTMEEELVSTAPYSLSIAVLDPEQCKRLSASVPAFMHEQVSGSVTNIYGTDFGHVEVKGTIQFAINYVNKLGELHIFIVQCRDLAAAEPKRNRTDPYVKCYLLPDKAKLGKRKTSVKKKTLNPTYNEILRYKIPLESLKVLTLNISVWHNDMFGRNSFLGEANVDLSEWDNNTHMMDRNLKGRIATPSSPTHVNHKMEMCGDMRISLRFLLQTSQSNKTPQTGEIQVWVKECTNLPTRRGTIDSFVKCSILADNHQKNRQKTQVVKRTANPVFNHTMVYEGIRPEDLRDTCVELTLWDHDRLSNHFIGGTRLGLGTGKSHGTEVKWMDSNSAESALWRRMIESNNEWVEDTIPLRMLIMAR